jgi:protein TonB
VSARRWLPPIAAATALHGAIALAPIDLDSTVAEPPARVTLRAVAPQRHAAPPIAAELASPDQPEAPRAPVAAARPTAPGSAPQPALGPPEAPLPAADPAPSETAADGVAGRPPDTGELAGAPAPLAPGPAIDRAAMQRYAARVRARMTRHKRYPARAARLGLAGTARVRLTIDDRGALAKPPRIARSSGHSALDAEAVRMARAGAPYPAPPDDRPPGPISVEVPVRFSAP